LTAWARSTSSSPNKTTSPSAAKQITHPDPELLDVEGRARPVDADLLAEPSRLLSRERVPWLKDPSAPSARRRARSALSYF